MWISQTAPWRDYPAAYCQVIHEDREYRLQNILDVFGYAKLLVQGKSIAFYYKVCVTNTNLQVYV